jgi:hypothetical protein
MRLKINRKNISLAAVVLLFLVTVILALNQLSLFKSNKTNLSPSVGYIKTNLPADKLPDAFPKNFIQEKNAIVLDNFSYEQNGKIQGTRKILSQKSVNENYNLYSKYFTDSGWKVWMLKKEINYKSFMATKPDAQGRFFADFYTSSNFPGRVVVETTFSPVK